MLNDIAALGEELPVAAHAEETVVRALRRAEEVELFPAAAARILAVADDPDSSLMDLEAAVSSDPSLSAQILRIANSAFYGLSRRVGSLRQALFVLGFEATRNIALGLAVLARGGASGARRAVWRHSLRTGIIAHRAARHLRVDDAGELMVSGLLHDFGKLLMLELGGPPYGEALTTLLGSDEERLTWERQLFGHDHATLGAACLEHWAIPGDICEAVRLHHELALEAVAEHLPAAVVMLADRLEQSGDPGELAPLAATLKLAPKVLHALTEDIAGEEAVLLGL